MLTQRDFDQLMQAAVEANASSLAPTIHTVCVQRELEPPFHVVKQWIDNFHQAGTGLDLGKTNFAFTGKPAIDRWIETAMAAGANVASRTAITSLSGSYVLFSSKSPKPPQCTIDFLPARDGRPFHDSAIALTFTRPVFAGGYVFIDEIYACPGLCGDGILNVFEKRHGKWTGVARQILWVS